MKAVILAAGKGVRMLPLTKDKPKVMIPVNGHPFLLYLIESLKRAGVTEFCFIVGYQGEKVVEFVRSLGLHADFVFQEEQLGTAHAVQLAEPYIFEDDFLVVNGDGLWGVDDIKKMMGLDDYNYIAGMKHAHPEKFGALLTKGDHVIGIVEKPQDHVSNLISTGMYKFKKEIFGAIHKIKKSPRGEYELPDAIAMLAKKDKVKVKVVEKWVDFGRLEDIPHVEEALEGYKPAKLKR
ncbi:NTP transferase domain-containing protein [Candidatus Woesearchaeota archaeon]|nr:NTP transferase domain-containing protein [Candidatus Woesearchaeota archaeon]